MPGEKYLEEANLISKDELLEHAVFSVMRDAKVGIPTVRGWMKGAVSKTPFTIYDINGKPLFRDFPIKRGRDRVGTVRTAASKILGSPIISTEVGPRYWSYASAVRKLLPKIKRRYRRVRILRVRPVCYSYPKIGAMFEMRNAQGRAIRHIYDVADLKKIPEKRDMPDREGAYAWSFYDSVPTRIRKRGLTRYNKLDNLRLRLSRNLRRKMRTARTLKSLDLNLRVLPFKLRGTKLLQFCPHYDYDEDRSHHCFILHGQQKSDYCAVATAQMILDYYRYYYSQDEIAPALGYSPGGCPSDQSPGYEELTCDHLDATFDESPTWEKARDEIDDLHPFKSGIPRHARACAGYSYAYGLIKDSSGSYRFAITVKRLYIYDPWPWNADYKLGGTINWEDWDSITHTNYVYTRLRCPE